MIAEVKRDSADGAAFAPRGDVVRKFRFLWLGIVALALSLGQTPARAEYTCSWADLGSAVEQSYKSAPTECAKHLENPIYYVLTVFMVGLNQGQAGKDFCAAVQNLKDQGEKAQKKMSDIWGMLSDEQKEKLSTYMASAGDNASDAIAGVDLVSCACKTAQWEGPGKVYTEWSNCVATGMCELQDWLHDNVWSEIASCSHDTTPPEPPHEVNCFADPRTKNANDPFYHFEASVGYVGSKGDCAGYTDGSDYIGWKCNGGFCASVDIEKSGTGNYCYCPQNMQTYQKWDGETNASCVYYMTCGCPADSTPLSADGAGKYICMCPDGLPLAQDAKWCPSPKKTASCDCSCPNNTVLISKDDKACTCNCGCKEGDVKIGDQCVSQCADASQVMLASGKCCAPSQAAACGDCCPVGMTPDAASGVCVSLPIKASVTPSGPVQVQPNQKF